MYSLIKKLIYSSLLLPLVILPLAAEEPQDYPSVTGPCNLEFPEDHGAHPDYRTEWWYYTGNLRTDAGKQYGFQLTFFRSRIIPPGADQKWPSPSSAWRTSQIYMAHAAVSDIEGRQHRYAEDVARGALGLAGVKQSAESTRIHLKDWSAQIEAQRHSLKVTADDFSYDLTFEPVKPVVLHGERGYSPKGSIPGRATCYYSFTRLEGKGDITVKGETVAVTGTAWMDHEFSSFLLDPGTLGWDWFSLQLSDRTEIMIFLIRKEDGSLHPASSGTYSDFRGQTRHLTIRDFKVTVLDTWKSRQSKARYPSRWRVQILPLSLDLSVASNLPDQEMSTLYSTGEIYWEGSVSVNGSRVGRAIGGAGYVELTGYAAPFDSPL
jgi:predicted secreted hydrolase